MLALFYIGILKKFIKILNLKYRYNTIQMFAEQVYEVMLLNMIENLKDLIIYQSQNNENISVEVLYNEEDFWLTQKSMSKLFNVAENNITYHLQNIFKTRELEESRTTQKIRVVQNEGIRKVSREVTFYSLDAIIAVGYRVNSKEATDFRIWATKTLKEYIKKVFVVNSEMLRTAGCLEGMTQSNQMSLFV